MTYEHLSASDPEVFAAVGNELRRHRYPSAADSRKLATLLRGVADSFDVQE